MTNPDRGKLTRASGETRHYQNFNALRLIAASTVVFSHSFLIATGSEETEPLHFTGRVTAIYGVFLFFILSGFLVTESAKRSSGLLDYFRKRFLRIAPALVVSTLLITYVVAPPFSTNGAVSFITDPETWREVILTVFLYDDGLYFQNLQFYELAGDASYLPHVANGVLWTIRLEVLGYIFVGILSALSLLKGRRQAVTVVLAAGLIAASTLFMGSMPHKVLVDLLFVAPSFCCGILMNVLVGYHRPNKWIAGLFLLGVIPALYFNVLPQAFPFIAAYPLIWLGSAKFAPFGWVGERSDISYGMYLYGWPVAMLLRAGLGEGMNGYQLALLALPATAIVALCSWRFVEKPALSLKRTEAKQALPAT